MVGFDFRELADISTKTFGAKQGLGRESASSRGVKAFFFTTVRLKIDFASSDTNPFEEKGGTN